MRRRFTTIASLVTVSDTSHCNTSTATPCLPKHGEPKQTVALFADALERIIAQHLTMHADYQLTHTGVAVLTLQAQTDAAGLHSLQAALQAYLDKQGVAVDALQWDVSDTVASDAMVVKRRRIKVQMA